MSIRGRAIQALVNRTGRPALEQLKELPPSGDDVAILGDGLALHGEWGEWLPGTRVRILGDEGLRIQDVRALLGSVGTPRALVLMTGTADLIGLAGSTSPTRAASRMNELIEEAVQQISPAPLYVVGVPGSRHLGSRADAYNSAVASFCAAREATFIAPPSGTSESGYLVSILRWSPDIYAGIASALAKALGTDAADARPVPPTSTPVKGILAQSQHKRAQLYEALPLPRGRVILYGDSITELGLWDGWLPGLPLANRGIAGDTVAQLHERIDSAIDAPLAVSILAGTNDLQRGDPKDPDAIGARFYSLVRDIRDRAPGVPIIINSVMPRAAKFTDHIEKINTHYRATAAEFDAEYLDLWPVLATPGRALRAELTHDALHLNADGYRAWVGLLRPALDRATAGRS